MRPKTVFERPGAKHVALVQEAGTSFRPGVTTIRVIRDKHEAIAEAERMLAAVELVEVDNEHSRP